MCRVHICRLHFCRVHKCRIVHTLSWGPQTYERIRRIGQRTHICRVHVCRVNNCRVHICRAHICRVHKCRVVHTMSWGPQIYKPTHVNSQCACIRHLLLQIIWIKILASVPGSQTSRHFPTYTVMCCAYALSWPTNACVGLARTIYIRCTYGILGLEITKNTVYICGYIRFWPALCMWHCRVRSTHASILCWLLVSYM